MVGSGVSPRYSCRRQRNEGFGTKKIHQSKIMIHQIHFLVKKLEIGMFKVCPTSNNERQNFPKLKLRHSFNYISLSHFDFKQNLIFAICPVLNC